jgi:hypothetical protein
MTLIHPGDVCSFVYPTKECKTVEAQKFGHGIVKNDYPCSVFFPANYKTTPYCLATFVPEGIAYVCTGELNEDR